MHLPRPTKPGTVVRTTIVYFLLSVFRSNVLKQSFLETQISNIYLAVVNVANTEVILNISAILIIATTCVKVIHNDLSYFSQSYLGTMLL